jgi:hypothetical protein
MRVSKHLVATVACLSLTACGIDVSETKDVRSTPETAVKPAAQGGTLELTSPPKRQDDKGELLQVTIRRSCGVWDMPVSSEDDDEEVESIGAPDAKPDIYDVEQEEEGEDGEIAPLPEPIDYGCHNYFYFEDTQQIELGSSKKISFSKLVEGFYDIEVMILDADGQVIEQGYSNAEVEDGKTSRARVELYKTVGDGRLKIDVVRAGDDQVGPAEKK